MIQKRMMDKEQGGDLFDFKKLTERKVFPSISTKRLLEINQLQKENLVNRIAIHIQKSQGQGDEPHLVTLFLDGMFELTDQQIKELAHIE